MFPGAICSSVFLVDAHLAAVQAPAAPATAGRDDGGIGRAVGAEAGALLDHAARRGRPPE